MELRKASWAVAHDIQVPRSFGLFGVCSAEARVVRGLLADSSVEQVLVNEVFYFIFG
jgi:hypothetical protein